MPAITTPLENPRTIVLKCESLAVKYGEGRCAATPITPGMLIEDDGNTAYPYETYVPHSSAGGVANRKIAVELGWIADNPAVPTQGAGVDNNYTEGDLIRYHICQPGDILWLLVAAGAGAILQGGMLQSAGDGTVEAHSSTNARLFQALEAVDNSGGSASVRIRAQAI